MLSSVMLVDQKSRELAFKEMVEGLIPALGQGVYGKNLKPQGLVLILMESHLY